MKLNLNLLDMLESVSYCQDSLQYLLMVELKNAGFPIEFDYSNPRNLCPKLLSGHISCTSIDNINILYTYHEKV